MFGRRVFASAVLPRAVWPSLHIQSARQAARLLPSLQPLTATATRQIQTSNTPLANGVNTDSGDIAALYELATLVTSTSGWSLLLDLPVSLHVFWAASPCTWKAMPMQSMLTQSS